MATGVRPHFHAQGLIWVAGTALDGTCCCGIEISPDTAKQITKTLAVISTEASKQLGNPFDMFVEQVTRSYLLFGAQVHRDIAAVLDVIMTR